MNKILLGLLVLMSVLSGACGVTTGGTRSPSALVKHMGSSTVALMVVGSVAHDEPRPYCTGVWVSKNVILTANHCVEGAWKMEFKRKLMQMDKEERDAAIEKWFGLSHAEHQALVVVDTPIHYSVDGDVDQVGKEPFALRLGKVLAVMPDHDLALVEAAGNNLPAHDVAMVADVNPGLGERLRVVGQPKGLYWSYIEGVVSAYRETLPEERSITTEVNEIDVVGPYLQVSAPVWYGNSGGGAFDEEGKLVGIASFLTGSPVSCYFIHGNVIRAFLKEHKIQ